MVQAVKSGSAAKTTDNMLLPPQGHDVNSFELVIGNANKSSIEGNTNSYFSSYNQTEKPVSSTQYSHNNSKKFNSCSANQAIKDKIVNKSDIAADELKEKLESYNDAVKDTVLKELDITSDELEQAMANLGLNYYDLLNPDNLKELAMEITGDADVMSLLVDENFSALFKSLGEIAADVSQSLDIPTDQLSNVLKVISDSDMTLMESTDDVILDTDMLNSADKSNGETVLQTTDAASNVNADNIDESMSVPTGQNTANLQTVENISDVGVKENIQVISTVVDDEAQVLQENTEKGNALQNTEEDMAVVSKEVQLSDNSEGQDENDSFLNEKNTENLKDIIKNSSSSKTIPEPVVEFNSVLNENYQTVSSVQSSNTTTAMLDIQDIINQITDAVKLTSRGDQTNLLMQLNPETLGKLTINVATKNGVITAQIAVTDEAVKHALETQVAQLRENMDQQGLKVDAVEVTIASHEFERNLENGNNGHNTPDDNSNNTSSGGSSSLEQSEDIIEDEVSSKIMRENGNTMNIMA